MAPEQDKNAGGIRPGDDYNRRTSWPEVLEPAGWTHVQTRDNVAHWRRPGKEGPGSSATTGFDGRDYLYVFSTNASPFEANRAYSKFAAYTMLHHQGDFRAAASYLASSGYGAKGLHASNAFVASPHNMNPHDRGGDHASNAFVASPTWPQMSPAAFYGLAGDIVKTIAPHSEADPVAVLIHLLVMFGNIIGRSAYYPVEATRHYMNIFAVCVGESSKGRKGTSAGHPRRLLEGS